MRRMRQWLRSLVIGSVAFAGLAFAQCSPSQTAFDTAYWLAQPAPVRVLKGGNVDSNMTTATNLAVAGYTIDVPIQVWGWDPCLVMKLRVDYGYTWVPSALQPPVNIAPGLTVPGQLSYDPSHPPGGSIKVSVNANDFPPFDPPPPAVVSVAITNPVGPLAFAGGTMYLTVTGDTSADGTKYTDPATGNAFVKHVVATPFGHSAWWEKTN